MVIFLKIRMFGADKINVILVYKLLLLLNLKNALFLVKLIEFHVFIYEEKITVLEKGI